MLNFCVALVSFTRIGLDCEDGAPLNTIAYTFICEEIIHFSEHGASCLPFVEAALP